MRIPPQPIASAFGAPPFSLRFPRATVDAEANLGCFNNNGEPNKTLMLTRVYYASHVSHHLLLVTAITKQGFTCMIGDKTQIWDKTGNLVIMAAQLNSSDSLHWFLLSLMQPDSNASSIQQDSDYLLWHRCMGHCSHNALCHAFNHVSGIPKLDVHPNL